MAIKPSKKVDAGETLRIDTIDFGHADFYLVGKSPFLCNRLAEKARHELLLPAPPKNRAEKASALKHEPLLEYRASPYQWKDDNHATRLKFPAGAFKKALAAAALDIPGAAKAEIGRLVTAQWQDVELFGVPKLHMSIVRQAGISRTPDVRTRAILPEWAVKIAFDYMQPKLNLQSVGNLLGASGLIVGVGDGRPQKGTFSFGQFVIVPKADKDWARITKEGGRAAQDAALLKPELYDEDTEDLYTWFYDELSRRGGKEGLAAEEIAADIDPGNA